MRYISAIMMARKSRRSRHDGDSSDVGDSFTAVASVRWLVVAVMSVVAVVVSRWVTWVMCRLIGCQFVASVVVVSMEMGWKVVVVMVVADVRNRFSAVRDWSCTSVVVVRLVEQERHNGKTIVHTNRMRRSMGLKAVIDGGDELWSDDHF